MSRRPPSPVSARHAPAVAAGGAPGRRPPTPPARAARARAPQSRQTGPDRGRSRDLPAEPRPARLARILSVRALVLGVVLLAGFTLLFPTVRAYLGQRAELDALAAEVTAAEQSELELERELDRWEDPAYVAAQARERLSFVMPGETAYRVIDPEVVVEQQVAETPAAAEAGPALPAGGAQAPWYAAVWESLEVAGRAPAVGAGE